MKRNICLSYCTCLVIPVVINNMYKFSSILMASIAVVGMVILCVTQSCNGFENVLSGCDIPPKFWCSSAQVAERCQV